MGKLSTYFDNKVTVHPPNVDKHRQLSHYLPTSSSYYITPDIEIKLGTTQFVNFNAVDSIYSISQDKFKK